MYIYIYASSLKTGWCAQESQKAIWTFRVWAQSLKPDPFGAHLLKGRDFSLRQSFLLQRRASLNA